MTRRERTRPASGRIAAPCSPWPHEHYVRIVATNVGILTHDVAVVSENVKPGDQPKKYGRTPTAHPGQTVSGSLTLHPGKYRLSDTIANHDSLGQYGELIVGSGR